MHETDDGLARLVAALEDQNARDIRNAELRRQIRTVVYVEFADFDLARELLRHFIDGRAQSTARPAPRRPEIDYDRMFALRHFFLPILAGEFQNLGTRHKASFLQGLLAMG